MEGECAMFCVVRIYEIESHSSRVWDTNIQSLTTWESDNHPEWKWDARESYPSSSTQNSKSSQPFAIFPWWLLFFFFFFFLASSHWGSSVDPFSPFPTNDSNAIVSHWDLKGVINQKGLESVEINSNWIFKIWFWKGTWSEGIGYVRNFSGYNNTDR